MSKDLDERQQRRARLLDAMVEKDSIQNKMEKVYEFMEKSSGILLFGVLPIALSVAIAYIVFFAE